MLKKSRASKKNTKVFSKELFSSIVIKREKYKNIGYIFPDTFFHSFVFSVPFPGFPVQTLDSRLVFHPLPFPWKVPS